MNNKVSYQEQIEQGLIRRPSSNFVAPDTRPLVLPPRNVPTIVDPYASVMPQSIQQVVKYEATPITRAHAMTLKVHQVTLFLALLTAAALVMFDQWYFFGWLFLASAEWVFVFIFLAVIDYREQPAAQHRHEMDRYLDMMAKEQEFRLRHIYPDQHLDKRRVK